MEIPTNLKHKPVIVVEDYDKVDGRNALNTDASSVSFTKLTNSSLFISFDNKILYTNFIHILHFIINLQKYATIPPVSPMLLLIAPVN